MASSTSGRGSGSSTNANQKKKKLAIFSGSAVLLLCMVVGVAVGVSRHNSSKGSSSDGGGGGLTTTSKAVKSICQPTDFKELCESSLSKAAGNATDPKSLVEASFNVTIDHIREAFLHSSMLQRAAKDPRTSEALDDCKSLLDYAIDELKASFAKLEGLDISKIDDIIDDLKVWLSAAVTYQETCLDGFENVTGDAAVSMRKALNSSQALTSNSLAIVDEISAVLSTFDIPLVSRRLLSEEQEEEEDGGEFPSWVANGKRRLLALATNEMKADVVVAQDGSGNYKTIKEALAAIPKRSNSTFVIHIKTGVYKEQVLLDKSMVNVMMVGDGPTKTRITGNLNFVDGTTTFNTATFAVVGDGFMARDIGFENSAGAEKHQAVALRVQSDRSIFYNCHMDGYQDTLYCHTKRQFYRDCTITGTIDFIFGDSASIFQNCLIKVRKPMANQQCIVTASGRKDRREATAIILQNCTISADAEYLPLSGKNPSYLGRPWKPYSRTIIMQSQIDGFINPQGWLPWAGDVGLSTCFYAEVENRGPGAATTKRVGWRGYKKIDYNHAQKFTVETFIQGNSWIKPTGVPYITGLLPATEAGGAH